MTDGCELEGLESGTQLRQWLDLGVEQDPMINCQIRANAVECSEMELCNLDSKCKIDP